MNWSNLREHKCPQCNKIFSSGALDLYIYCDCGFTISLERFEEIVMSQISKDNPRKPVFVDNQSELNNL